MEFVCYREWDQLPGNAHQLFAKAAEDSVFFSQPWFEVLLDNALDDGQSLMLACVVDAGRVVAILPLVTSSSGHLQTFGHLYTSLYTLLIAEHCQQATLTCLSEGLSRLPVESLRLAPIAEDDSDVRKLQDALSASGYACFRKFRFWNWTHRLQGESFADYMAARPSKVRNTIIRKQRKLAREQGYRIRLFAGDDWQQGMVDYNAVYSASWKAKELFSGFVENLAERLSRQDWLRLAVLYIGDQPAAAQFWFVAHGKASIFKLAYDEAWKQYSPGSILTHHLMRHVIDIDRVEEIDFLTGNDAYKSDWMSERRERWGLYCGKPRQRKSTTGRLVATIKSWVQRGSHLCGNSRCSSHASACAVFSSRNLG